MCSRASTSCTRSTWKAWPKISGRVVVLGGGNTAMDCARSALRAGAEHVTIAYRRSEQEMPAITEERHEAKAEGIEFAVLRQPVGFHGNGRVQEVELAIVELGRAGRDGAPEPGRDRRDAARSLRITC